MKKIILFAAFLLIVGCGARKMNKSTTETQNKEEAHDKGLVKVDDKSKITTVNEVDTVAEVPGVSGEKEKPLEDLKEKPLIDETDRYKTETSYDPQTKSVKTKTQIKPVKVPVKQKTTVTEEKNVKTSEAKDLTTKKAEKNKVDAKVVDAEGASTGWAFALGSWAWVIIIVVVLFLLWYFGILRRKSQPEK